MGVIKKKTRAAKKIHLRAKAALARGREGA
jgi:hypothetical protein